MRLKAITVKEDNGRNFRYEAEIERWQDVLWVARRGTDGYGREIVNMEIERDGKTYTNYCGFIRAIYKDVKLEVMGSFAREVTN